MHLGFRIRRCSEEPSENTVLFSSTSAGGTELAQFVKTPISTWRKFTVRCDSDATNKYPQFAIERAANFLEVMSNIKPSVPEHIDKSLTEHIKKNLELLKLE